MCHMCLASYLVMSLKNWTLKKYWSNSAWTPHSWTLISFFVQVLNLGTTHLLPKGGLGRKLRGLRRINDIWGGVYEKFCAPLGGDWGSMENKAMACAVIGSLSRKNAEIWGVYEKFWILKAGSVKNFHARMGGLGKFSEFCTISARYPPTDNKWPVPYDIVP